MVGFLENSTQFQFAGNNGNPSTPSGTVFSWTVARYNHLGSSVESGTGLTGMIYTPDLATCFNLLSKISGNNSLLSQIYSAVHTVYPAT